MKFFWATQEATAPKMTVTKPKHSWYFSIKPQLLVGCRFPRCYCSRKHGILWCLKSNINSILFFIFWRTVASVAQNPTLMVSSSIHNFFVFTFLVFFLRLNKFHETQAIIYIGTRISNHHTKRLLTNWVIVLSYISWILTLCSLPRLRRYRSWNTTKNQSEGIVEQLMA